MIAHIYTYFNSPIIVIVDISLLLFFLLLLHQIVSLKRSVNDLKKFLNLT